MSFDDGPMRGKGSPVCSGTVNFAFRLDGCRLMTGPSLATYT
jgi:hypothetical protein